MPCWRTAFEGHSPPSFRTQSPPCQFWTFGWLSASGWSYQFAEQRRQCGMKSEWSFSYMCCWCSAVQHLAGLCDTAFDVSWGNGWQHKQFQDLKLCLFRQRLHRHSSHELLWAPMDPQPLQHLQLGSAIKRTKSCEHPLQMSWSSINKPRAACRKPQLKSWPSINKPRAARWEPRNWNTIDPCLAPGSKRTFHPQIKENLWPRWLGNSWSLTSTPIPVASEAEGLGPSNQEAIVLLHPGHWNQDTCEAIAKLNYQHINYGTKEITAIHSMLKTKNKGQDGQDDKKKNKKETKLRTRT